MEQEMTIKNDINQSPKTGDWKYIKPVINNEKCNNCGICFSFCPEAAIEQRNKKIAKIDYDFCKGCGVCANVCSTRAIIMKKM